MTPTSPNLDRSLRVRPKRLEHEAVYLRWVWLENFVYKLDRFLVSVFCFAGPRISSLP